MWLAVVPGLMVVSCEKIREITGKARAEAEEVASGGIVQPGGGVAPEMEALIDLNEQGYRFRRDQPFPDKLTVRRKTSLEISNGRLFGRSALGNGSTSIEGTSEDVVVLEREASRVTIRVESDRFVKPIIEGEGEGETTGEAASEPESRDSELGESLEGLSATFLKRDKGWQVVGEQDDFRVMAWASQLRGQLDDYLLGSGVIPNSPWFGPKRMLPGVEVELHGPETCLILGAEAKGSLLLKFDRVENIGGHPCGVFNWSGEFTIAEAASLSGEPENLEMSVSSGQIWCSLIHPLVLRSEMEGVMTVERRGPDGRLSMRLQGAVKSTDSRQWTPAGE